MKKKLWWFNNREAKFPFNNRGEVNPPLADPPPTDPPPTDPPTPPIAGSYADIVAKKGFKDQEAFAKNYTELEGDRSRKDAALQAAKTGVETQSQGTLTINEKGEVVPVQGAAPAPGPGQPGYQQAPQVQYDQYGRPIQQGQQFQQSQDMFDPYTGLAITNPLDRQLANMPLSQRIVAVIGALNTQTEQNQGKAILAEGKVLSQDSAKGFEEDVRKIMQQLPLIQRADENKWTEALLKAKGAKFDWAMQNKGKASVEEFLNKIGGQQLPAAPGTGDTSAQLTPDQETAYKYYETTHPGMFKDRAHFKNRLSPTGDGAPARM